MCYRYFTPLGYQDLTKCSVHLKNSNNRTNALQPQLQSLISRTIGHLGTQEQNNNFKKSGDYL